MDKDFKKAEKHTCTCKNGCSVGGPCCGRCHSHPDGHHHEKAHEHEGGKQGADEAKTLPPLAPKAMEQNLVMRGPALGFGSLK